MTKKEVLVRVENWRDYCAARAKDADKAGDISSAMTWRGDAKRASDDLAWLKRGTNWRSFERDTYAHGTRTPWTFIYPARIDTPLCR